MKFKNGDRVTCKILGTEITDARISIGKDGMLFICQDVKNGVNAEDKLGYKYAWYLFKDFTHTDVTDLKLATTPTWDSLSWKDIVLDEDGDRRMVLAVVNDMVCISYAGDFDVASGWFHKKQLQRYGYTIQGEVPAVEEITIKEAEARFGVKIKTN